MAFIMLSAGTLLFQRGQPYISVMTPVEENRVHKMGHSYLTNGDSFKWETLMGFDTKRAQKLIKKFATTTEEIRRILRLVANFTGTGENKVREGNLYIREGTLSLSSDHLDISCSPGSRRQKALFR